MHYKSGVCILTLGRGAWEQLGHGARDGGCHLMPVALGGRVVETVSGGEAFCRQS